MPLTEKALISSIRSHVRQGKHVIAGVGDDCAILRLPTGREALLTTDFSLENVHFRRNWHPSEAVGHRCLARGLSDIAAMGGEPVAAFLSLALPRDLPQKWVDGFMHGLLKLAGRYKVTLAGGDTAESRNGILADIILFGYAPQGKAIRRSGARPGDHIYVSGDLGGSASTLAWLRKHPTQKLSPRKFQPHFFPEPRVALGRLLREKNLASAMIDLSDGLSTDLAHICEESGVGARIEADKIPRARTVSFAGEVDLSLALHGGEDYELLFTAPARKRIPASAAGVRITEIGEITRGPKIALIDSLGASSPLLPHGWEHFAPGGK